MPQILQNWNGPIISLIRNILSRGSVDGLRWSDAIDPNQTTGNPPSLDSSQISLTMDMPDFCITIARNLLAEVIDRTGLVRKSRGQTQLMPGHRIRMNDERRAMVQGEFDKRIWKLIKFI